MRFSFNQELRQEQKQILTQRMILSMEILQLSALELEERIDQELRENPVLELSGDIPEPVNNDDEQPKEPSEYSGDLPLGLGRLSDTIDSSSEITSPADEDGPERRYEREPEMSFENGDSGIREEFRTADDFAQNYSDTIDELPARSQNWLENQENKRNDVFANIASPPQSLQSYLSEQLGWFELSPEMQEMTRRVIYHLDADGYFSFENDEFLGEQCTEAEKELAAKALELVRKLDPPGVGGKDLKDCLLLQVNREDPLAEVLQTLIKFHLEDISANRIPLIVRTTGYSLETVQEAIGELKHLNPRPGSNFKSETEVHKIAVTVIPDVIVEKNDVGRYIVRLGEGKSRSLSINPYYEKMKKNRKVDKATGDFITRNVGSARWLIDSIEQRRATLTKTAQAIVDYQTDFFESGPHALKPLKMQQIADVVGVHITTVSRACNDKWMLTPQGAFPFSHFFNGTVSATDEGQNGIAQKTVWLKLKEIVDKEDKNTPYSDDTLVKILADNGIKIARRTVVKYREQMNIPSSVKRKCWGGK